MLAEAEVPEADDDTVTEEEEEEEPPASSEQQQRRRVVRQVRFPKLLHKENFPLRSDLDRLTSGREALQNQLNSRNLRLHVEGIRGITALRDIPKFRETWSNTSDTLHVVAEGLVQRILTPMVVGKGESHNFLRNNSDTLSHQKMLQQSVRSISELDHVTGPLDDLKSWKALDYMNFLLIEVALLCCDEDVISDLDYYGMWVYLANCVYLMHDGNPTVAKLEKLKKYMRKFTEKYVEVMGPWQCVPKFHLFQHFVELVELHGPAFLWDAFPFERLQGILKRDVTTTKHYLTQIGRNFVLRFFSDPFLKQDQFCDGVKAYLKMLNIDHFDSSLVDLPIVPLTTCIGTESIFPEEVEADCCRVALLQWTTTTAEEFRQLEKERVTRLRW
jgi:hypothetical protein